MDMHPVAWIKNKISLLDIALGLAVAGLYLTSFHSYLLFHTLAEILRVSMAVAIFMLALNVRNSLDNSSLLFISAAYVFVCGLEILHALASQGLGAFPPDEPNLAAQLWIAARYMESVSFLLAPLLLNRKLKLRSSPPVFPLLRSSSWRPFFSGGYSRLASGKEPGRRRS